MLDDIDIAWDCGLIRIRVRSAFSNRFWAYVSRDDALGLQQTIRELQATAKLNLEQCEAAWRPVYAESLRTAQRYAMTRVTLTVFPDRRVKFSLYGRGGRSYSTFLSLQELRKLQSRLEHVLVFEDAYD